MLHSHTYLTALMFPLFSHEPKATLKNNSVSVRLPGWDSFTALPGRIFVVVERLKYFSHFSSDFQTVFTKVFPGRPGGFILPHPVDRKQTFFLVLPSFSHKTHVCMGIDP